MQFISRSHRAWPLELVKAEANNAASGFELTVDQKPHRHRCRVPPARREAAEDGVGCRCLIEMKGLRIELRGKGLDALLVDPDSSRAEGLSNSIVLEISLGHRHFSGTARKDGRLGVGKPSQPGGSVGASGAINVHDGLGKGLRRFL